MEAETPTDAARLIQSVLAELGWKADAKTVAESVRRLDIGLPIEDEFSVLCSWLGKCRLIHKLDQQQVPVRSREQFQVPDLLACFTTQRSSSPLLIEVKSNTAGVLSFKPDYLARLLRYSDLIQAPLLIAWKHHGLWTLFEASHLRMAKRNLNISFSEAMKENLLSALAGDVAYKIGAGAGVHFRFRKDTLLEERETDEGRIEEWKMVIDDVGFSDYAGNRRAELPHDVSSLFTAWHLEEKQTHTPTHIHLSYVAGGEGMQFAHMALVHLLSWESPRAGRPLWRPLLKRDQVTANVENFEAALRAAMSEKVVSHIFHLMPHSRPDFLQTSSSSQGVDA